MRILLDPGVFEPDALANSDVVYFTHDISSTEYRYLALHGDGCGVELNDQGNRVDPEGVDHIELADDGMRVWLKEEHSLAAGSVQNMHTSRVQIVEVRWSDPCVEELRGWLCSRYSVTMTQQLRPCDEPVAPDREPQPTGEEIDLLLSQLDGDTSNPERSPAFLRLRAAKTHKVLDWLETNLTRFSPNWTQVVVASEFDWSRACRWLERGRPLSLAALAAMSELTLEESFVHKLPPTNAVVDVLQAHQAIDPVPRVRMGIESIIQNVAQVRG